MRWKTRQCVLPVGDRDFSRCPGSDPGWYAAVWLMSALLSGIMCVLWVKVSQIPPLYSSLGWGEEDGNSSTHSTLTPSACFYWSLIFLLIPLLQPPLCIFTSPFFPSLCYSILFASLSSFFSLVLPPFCCAWIKLSVRWQKRPFPFCPDSDTCSTTTTLSVWTSQMKKVQSETCSLHEMRENPLGLKTFFNITMHVWILLFLFRPSSQLTSQVG